MKTTLLLLLAFVMCAGCQPPQVEYASGLSTAAARLTAIGPQTPTGDQGLFFYNSVTGSAVFGSIVNHTAYQDIRAYSPSLLGTDWTNIIPFQGRLICYNANTGAVSFFDGVTLTRKPFAMRKGFTHLVPIQDKYVLLYNSTNGVAVWGYFTAQDFVQTSANSFSTGWVQIIAPTDQNQVVFWKPGPGAANNNVGGGVMVLGTVTNGIFTQTETDYPWFYNFFQFLPYKSGHYIQASVGVVPSQTEFFTLGTIYELLGSFYNTPPGISHFGIGHVWTDYVYLNRDMFFYDAPSGYVTILDTHDSLYSQFTRSVQTGFSTGWTHIVPIRFN